MLPQPIYILLADDDEDDRYFFEEAIKNIKQDIILQHVENGLELMKSLNTEPIKIPDVIFLDLNMPLKSGYECLQEIKSHPELKLIPIVIYSTSSDVVHIEKTYEDGANLYISKPTSIQVLEKIINEVLTLDCRKYKPQPKKEKYVFKY
ncbi:MAG TPA: response regulator [Saprospiraceae bacterium]|nr:response regulator [Saprospiraceae bacterium]